MKHDLVVAGKVVSSVGVEEMEIGISDGKIAEMKRQGLAGRRTIKAGRALVFPGFIDIHVHMREPGWEQKEDFRTGSEAAVHGGVTTVADMPNNLKPAINLAVLREKARLASKKALVDVKFYGGVVYKELNELRRISSLVSGYKLYLAKTTGNLMFPPSELKKVFGLVAGTGRPASLHCEDQEIIDARTKEEARHLQRHEAPRGRGRVSEEGRRRPKNGPETAGERLPRLDRGDAFHRERCEVSRRTVGMRSSIAPPLLRPK